MVGSSKGQAFGNLFALFIGVHIRSPNLTNVFRVSARALFNVKKAMIRKAKIKTIINTIFIVKR